MNNSSKQHPRECSCLLFISDTKTKHRQPRQKRQQSASGIWSSLRGGKQPDLREVPKISCRIRKKKKNAETSKVSKEIGQLRKSVIPETIGETIYTFKDRAIKMEDIHIQK